MTKEDAYVKANDIPPPGRRPEDPVKLAQRDRDARWIVKYSKAKGDKRALAYLLNKNNTSCSV
jgi:hypothetical protein